MRHGSIRFGRPNSKLCSNNKTFNCLLGNYILLIIAHIFKNTFVIATIQIIRVNCIVSADKSAMQFTGIHCIRKY